MNKNTYQGKWTEIKGEVQKLWGNVTNDDLEKAKGDSKILVGLIQQKLGKTQDNVEEKVNGIFEKLHVPFERAVQATKEREEKNKNNSSQKR